MSIKIKFFNFLDLKIYLSKVDGESIEHTIPHVPVKDSPKIVQLDLASCFAAPLLPVDVQTHHVLKWHMLAACLHRSILKPTRNTYRSILTPRPR